MVCHLTDHTIGLFLLDISLESARVVLNRLRWLIGNHRISFGGKADFSVTISLVYSEIPEARDEDLLAISEAKAAEIGPDERNAFVPLKG